MHNTLGSSSYYLYDLKGYFFRFSGYDRAGNGIDATGRDKDSANTSFVSTDQEVGLRYIYK